MIRKGQDCPHFLRRWHQWTRKAASNIHVMSVTWMRQTKTQDALYLYWLERILGLVSQLIISFMEMLVHFWMPNGFCNSKLNTMPRFFLLSLTIIAISIPNLRGQPLSQWGWNHTHILVDYKGHELIEDLVREIKKASTKFIKENKLSKCAFNWQSGYATVSVGYSQLDTVIKYILRQEEHHRKNSFRNEYLFLLNKYEIEYKDQYLFDFLDWRMLLESMLLLLFDPAGVGSLKHFLDKKMVTPMGSLSLSFRGNTETRRALCHKQIPPFQDRI
jgi:hypothetical protein